MLKKYFAKFTIDIMPSILATIVGAYIVNHYIAPKSDPAQPAAAVASVPDADAKAPGNKAAAKPAETSADVASIPDGAKASEKAPVEKASIDKSETAERRHQASREKAVTKAAPATPAAVAPALATVGTAPSDTAAIERRDRDANDLARAAIERLSREQARPQEAARAPDVPHVQEAMRTAPAQSPSVQSMQQLPPPIIVATPSIENPNLGQQQAPVQQADQSDIRRLRPPGDIPAPMPVDLQADASAPPRDRTNVAEDVLSAAKSVFHSVIPKPFDR